MSVLQLDQYQKFTRTTAIYPPSQELSYLMLGITSEVGEVADIIKKQIRDNDDKPFTQEQLSAIQKELGDVLWYLARISDHFGFSLQETMLCNMIKLRKRQDDGMISGSGDDR